MVKNRVTTNGGGRKRPVGGQKRLDGWRLFVLCKGLQKGGEVGFLQSALNHRSARLVQRGYRDDRGSRGRLIPLPIDDTRLLSRLV